MDLLPIMTSLAWLLLATVGCYLLGGGLALILQRWPGQALLWGYALAFLGAGCGLVTALVFFLEPHPEHFLLFPMSLLPGASFELLLDPLAAFFLLIISAGGLLASLYAFGYCQE